MNEPGDATKRLGGLAAIEIPSAGPVASAFVSLGITRFGHAVEYVAALPYGRNSDGQQFRLVLSERRGTCSTKHALLAELVTELNLPLDLMLGIFEMSEANTPGVGGVLQAHRLDAIPEAHCYLRSGADRIDATSAASLIAPSQKQFLYEEVIKPDQVGAYKKMIHQQFLTEWRTRNGMGSDWTTDRLWRVREECIAALSDA